MTEISPITEPQNSTSGPNFFMKTKELDSNDFLKLMMVQLQNQDPMSPMDNTQFIAQMASFTSLANSKEQVAKSEEQITLLQSIKTAVDHMNDFIRNKNESTINESESKKS